MWELIDRKVVRNCDGFWAELSLYCDGDRFVTVFGDPEWYLVEDEDNWDFITDSAIEAYEYFHNY